MVQRPPDARLGLPHQRPPQPHGVVLLPHVIHHAAIFVDQWDEQEEQAQDDHDEEREQHRGRVGQRVELRLVHHGGRGRWLLLALLQRSGSSSLTKLGEFVPVACSVLGLEAGAKGSGGIVGAVVRSKLGQ